jgi:hypothetical protein
MRDITNRRRIYRPKLTDPSSGLVFIIFHKCLMINSGKARARRAIFSLQNRLQITRESGMAAASARYHNVPSGLGTNPGTFPTCVCAAISLALGARLRKLLLVNTLAKDRAPIHP